MKNLVILGAGTAGTMMANKLHRDLNLKIWNITIIDKDEIHYYQPGFLFIPFGIYQPEDVVRTKKRSFYLRGLTSSLAILHASKERKTKFY